MRLNDDDASTILVIRCMKYLLLIIVNIVIHASLV